MDNLKLMLARVTNVCRIEKKVVLAIQYYDNQTAEISFVDIQRNNPDFQIANLMNVGDEVLASPCEENRIYRFHRKRWLIQRIYVSSLKRLILKVKPFF